MRVFLHGIGGVGMSALAGLFIRRGDRVLGSDRKIYPPSDQILQKMGIRPFSPFSSQNIPENIDLSVMGNIISRGNPEAEHVLNRGLEYLSMAEALYRFFIKGHHSIVVAGTHGKTTTASFLAFLLEKAGYKPGYFIGGKPLDLPGGYALGSESRYFVVEGDEYETAFFDRSSKFLKYHPRFLVITSLEYDHLDFFPSRARYLESFRNLINQVPSEGLIIINHDYPMARKAVQNACTPVISYGGNSGDKRIGNLRLVKEGIRFTMNYRGKEQRFSTPLEGRYDVWNLCAGILLAEQLGIEDTVVLQAVTGFRGVKRRLTQIRQSGELRFYEDFAHHPTAIGGVIHSLKERYRGIPLSVLFEPASASLRRQEMTDALIHSLSPADRLWFREIDGKKKLVPGKGLDADRVIRELRKRGMEVRRFATYQEMREKLQAMDTTDPGIVLLISNGAFGGLPDFVRYRLFQ